MERVITVKGIGHVSVKPDLVIVSLKLITTSLDYGQCMKIAGERNDLVKTAIIKSGLPDDSLKASSFNIGSETYIACRHKKNEAMNLTQVCERFWVRTEDATTCSKRRFDAQDARFYESLNEK